MKAVVFQAVSAMFFLTPLAASTRIPFSGPLGATAGAGALMGWEIHGQGLNPAVGEPRRLGLSLATYAPFGMEQLRISEAGLTWSGKRWGTGIDYRGWDEPMGHTSAWELREALNLGKGFRGGLSTLWSEENGTSGIRDFGIGLLWNGIPAMSIGGLAGSNPGQIQSAFHAGLGADAGFALKNGYGFRLCLEGRYRAGQPLEWRLGAKARLHSLLSLHAGFNPAARTSGLGLQFGMGAWEGFHALRIHSVLGSSSIQSIRWKRRFGSLRP